MKNIETHSYLPTTHKLTFSLIEWLDILVSGLVVYISAKPQKKEVFKEWSNGDKVIIVNNSEESIWTGVIVDEDYMMHDTYMPVVKDDKTGDLIQSGGVFLKNDEEGIMLNALLKLDWNERWNLVSKGRAGIYKKDHFKTL